MASYRERVAAAAAMHHAPNALVSRILQVALGLFVTTSDLPTSIPDNPLLSYDCSFDTECKWISGGTHFDRWRVAKGEPDSLLWLAATGTMQLPSEPFALIEIRGQTTDVLISDTITCQEGTSTLSFIYWAIGNADLEVCLADVEGVKFNCTGLLESPVMPGKVLLKIPEMQRPFRIMISPNTLPGILIVDDIRYDAQSCEPIKTTKKREATTQPLPTEGVIGTTPIPATVTTEMAKVEETTESVKESSTSTQSTSTTESTTTSTTSQTTTSSSTKTTTTPSTTMTPSTTTSTTTTTTTSTLTSEHETPPDEAHVVEESESAVETTETPSQVRQFTTPIPARTTTTESEPEVVIDELEFMTTTDAAPGTTMSMIKKMELWRATSTKIQTTTQTTTTTTTQATTTATIPHTTTDVPFDLLIYGNRTSPLFDRRLNVILSDTSKLLCDFKEEFACQWGAEAGRWAIVQEGAIPSLEEDIGPDTLPPTFPAALVLQGTVMLTSDPVRCQKGPGKVLFRSWSNGNVTVQVCALGYGIDSNRIECFDRQPASVQDSSLAVFEIPGSIKEAFTLNIVPQWEAGAKNKYLLIDEIAYIGECVSTSTSSPTTTTSTAVPTTSTVIRHSTLNRGFFTIQSTTPEPSESTEEEETTEEEDEDEATTPKKISIKPHKKTRVYPMRTITTMTPLRTSTSADEEGESEESGTVTYSTPRPAATRYTPSGLRYVTTTARPVDYCSLLNCNFDENACNYLNHGLTKVPWTLRNRGYGYPLSGSTDVRPVPTNGQFVSSLLAPGDVAILESPKFNLSSSLNVLLFQYYRPSQSSTIRLCLGSRYTTPLRTVAAFARCPSILRAVTARNAFRWNTVHVQLPPGTTHFFLVAHNSERADSRTSIALDNMRVAICDPKNFAPEEVHRMFSTTFTDEPIDVGSPRADGVVLYRNERVSPPLHSLGESEAEGFVPVRPSFSAVNPLRRFRSAPRFRPTLSREFFDER